MGNSGSSGNGGRRRQGSRRSQPTPAATAAAQPEARGNNYIFAAATPYPAPYPNPNPNPTAAGVGGGYYHYQQPPPPPPGYYPPPPPPLRMPLPSPYDHHHNHQQQVNWGRYPPPPPSPAPYVEHQKAVTIRNDINLKKDTLSLEPDHQNPGNFLLAFTFDATLPGSITIIYFAKEGDNCKLTPTKEDLLPPVTVHFEKGLGQKFRQPSGTGIDFSMFEESDLMKRDTEVCPLAVKADACPANVAETDTETETDTDTGSGGNLVPDNSNSQITQAVFEKVNGEYKVKVLKQILWVNGMRYELQEIYGIGNTVEGDFDGNDPGKECVICLSEPRDTTVLPCRHMCMCSGCAKVLRFQTNRCPICRQPVERLLEIKVNNGNEEEKCA